MSQIAISNIAWTSDEDRAAYALLAKLGIKGLEVAPTRIHPDVFSVSETVLKDFKKLVRESSGAEIVSLQSLHFGRADLRLFGDKQSRSMLYDHTRKAVDMAVTLGASNLVFGSPKNRLVPDDFFGDPWTEARNFFMRLGEYATCGGVTVSIEANPEVYGTNFITTTKDALTMAQEINIPGIRINLDLGACFLNQEDIAEVVSRHTALIGHIHISEPMLETIPGRVEIERHKRLGQAVKGANYNRWLSLEMKASGSDNLAGVRRAIEFVNDIYQ